MILMLAEAKSLVVVTQEFTFIKVTHPKLLHYCNHSLITIMATRGRIGIKLTDGSILSVITGILILNGLVSILSNISTPTIKRLS